MTSNITPKTSKSWLSDKEEVAFIDVREIGQHTSGHPFFSISIQYSLFELKIETERGLRLFSSLAMWI